MLQVRKVVEHVYEKVMGQGSDAGSQTAGGGPGSTANSTGDKSETEKEEDISSIAEEKVELMCNDQVSTGIRISAKRGYFRRIKRFIRMLSQMSKIIVRRNILILLGYIRYICTQV